MRIRLTGRGHAAGLLSELNRCRLSRRYCDVFLQVGNRSFCAHRAVLACSGTYFQNLLSRTPNTSTTTTTSAFSLEFISPANFEKVLTFVYTGEISTDLIDVGTLYELAERLGVSELVKACHATFPDLQTNCTDIALDSGSAVSVSGVNVASVCASSVCSSAASCSSLSSSTAPTPAAAAAAAAGAPPSPLCQAGTSREETEAVNTGGGRTLELKAEEVQCHIGYGQMATDHNQQLQGDHHQLPGGHSLLTSSHSSQSDGPRLILKTEQVEGEETGHSGGTGGRGGTVSEDGTRDRDRGGVSGSVASFPDSSAQLQVPSSGEPLSNLQVGSVTGGVMFTEGEDTDHEADREALHGNTLHGNVVMEGAEEEWNQLTDDIIELSDDETYLEEEEEEEEEEEGDLVCVENGEPGNPGRQMPEPLLSCKVCSAPLPADPSSISKHSETHLTELGLCRVCGVSFQDRPTAVSHSLSHVGVQLYACDMCNTQFLSLNKLLRHHRQTACSYTIPQGALSNSNQGVSPELQCAVCNKTLSKDFQSVRDHALSHVCPQSLRCGLCDVPLLSLCSLLWHCLSHLSLPVYSCPHCARCFTERPQLDRHMATHAAEAVARETERSLLRAIRIGADGNDVIRGGGANTTTEELHCFLCPQTFRTSAAFQYHLSLHTSDSLGGSGGGGGQSWLGKRKADQSIESTCSSSSPRDSGGLVKMSNLGLGLGLGVGSGVGGFSVPDKFFQGSLQSLTNGGLGQDAGGASRGKWYRCRYCGKRFAHSGEFTYHLRIHTGEKPYQCKVCLRFFRGRSTMICHLKTHAGALMYRCTVCGLYFSTLKLVASHMELHKDNLPADFHIEQTFMYNDHSKEPLPTGEA